MTDALEIRHVSPTYPPKSDCGVPPQTVAGGVQPPICHPPVDDFRPQPYSRRVGVSPTFFHINSEFQRLPHVPPQRKSVLICDGIAAALPEGDLHRLSPDAIHLLVVEVSCCKSSNIMLTPQ